MGRLVAGLVRIAHISFMAKAVFAVAAILLAIFATPVHAAEHDSAAQIEVDMQLVLATDVSGSIDDGEAFLQRKGVADAFRSRDVQRAIESGGIGRIAVTYVDFSSFFYNQVIVEWFVISDEASAIQFANLLMSIPRTQGRGTSMSDAIELGIHLFEQSPYSSLKRVIDISGDGFNNTGRPLREVRDEAVARGITINGLPIMDAEGFAEVAELDAYFASCVIGGTGAFLQKAEGFGDFARAIRRKLILELAKDEQLYPPGGALLFRIADSGTPLPPMGITPQAPVYEGACDTWEFSP